MAVLLLLGLAGCSSRAPQQRPRFEQLTSGGGESSSPGLSPDGKLVAFVSDEADADNLDIWVRPVDQGVPRRLTSDPAKDYDPVFSGDSRTIYFTSLREPAGIYRVPVSGGAAELVLRGAMSAQAAPSGNSIAYVAASGKLALFSPGDGSSRELIPDFYSSYAPKWLPDGNEILFAGNTAKEEAVDWWTVAVDGGAPRNTGLLAALRQRGFVEAYLQAWMPGGEILFAGKRGDQITLWQAKLSAAREIAGEAVRATDGEAGEFHASYGAGRIAFDRTRVVLNLWSLPVDSGRMAGNPQRLTSTEAQKGNAALSREGRSLLYSSEEKGTFQLRLRDIVTSREKKVGPSSNTFYGALNADGSRYLYGSGPKEALDVFARGSRGWRSWWPQSVCKRCGMPRGFSADGKVALLWVDSGTESRVDLVELGSGKTRTVLAPGSDPYYGPELSPDGAWISFVVKSGEQAFRAFIAPIPPQGAASRGTWIPVGASQEYQMPFWAPDGNLLYILSEHGEGNLNWLDALPLDPQSKRPTGGAFAVYHFKEPRVPTMDAIWNHPAAAQARIVLELGDMSSNIWLMDAAR